MVWNPSISAEEQSKIGLTFVAKLGACDLPGMSSVFQAMSPIPWQIDFSQTHGKNLGGISFVLVLVMKKMQSFGSSEGTVDLALEIGGWYATNSQGDAGKQGH